jgi:hypothetical protein
MAKDNYEKGRFLEEKVAELLKAVFEYDPKLKTSDFYIKLNETLQVNGVPYQIDVWVETAKSSSFYRSVFIYECKNWREPVGKAEVSSLAKKVEALEATRGFLVAHRFTKHAHKLVESEPRIALLECSDDFSNFMQIEASHVAYEPTKLSLTIQSRYAPKLFNNEQELQSMTCQFNGELMPFPSFQEMLLRTFFRQYELGKPLFSHYLANHFAAFDWSIPYAEGQLLIGQIDIASLRIDAKFFVYFQPMHLISKFEIKGMGRTCSLAHKDEIFSGANYQIDLLLRA